MSNKRWEPEFRTTDTGIEITVTQPEDPAYQLIKAPNIYTQPDHSIYRMDCYICNDPEFAQMGLPLCRACEVCKVGHVAADDTRCDTCGADAEELWIMARQLECVTNGGHDMERHPAMLMQTFFLDPRDGRPFNVGHADMTDLAYDRCRNCGEIDVLYGEKVEE